MTVEHPDGVSPITRRPISGRQRIWIILVVLSVSVFAIALTGLIGPGHKRPDTTSQHGIDAGMPYTPPAEPATPPKSPPMPNAALSIPKIMPVSTTPTKDAALEAPIFSSAAGEGGTGSGKSARVGGGDEGNGKDDEFSNELKVSDVGGPSRAKKMRHPEFTIPAGVVISCILQTAINSELKGFVDCVLPADVRSADGTVALLDKGTTVLGQIRSGLTRGQERLFILWTRARTPDNITIDLASPAADELGRAGVGCNEDANCVNDHFWKMLWHSLLFSIVEYGPQIGVQALQNQNQNHNNNTQLNSYLPFFQPQQQLANTILEADLHIPPTLEKNQGDAVSIFVARDLHFDDVYSLQVKR